MRTGLKISALLIAVIMTSTLMGQTRGPENLAKFDTRKLHFGFILAYNSANFIVERNENYFGGDDSLVGVENQRVPGFNIQIVSSYAFTPGLRVRFLPGLSFQDRILNYRYLNADGSITTEEKRVDATFLEFPVDLKFRTWRLTNFATYFMGGAKYGIDMSSRADVSTNAGAGQNALVLIKRNNLSYEAGVGFDFFLEFFKFGIEVKYAFGSGNVLIQDNTMFSLPLNSLRTNLWTVSLTFEG